MSSPLGDTEVHDLWSDAVGDTFRVFVGHCGQAPEAILVVSDASGLFGLTVDTVRLMQIPALVPSLLVVGIGYPGAETILDTVEIRTRDLTPTPGPNFAGSGYAANFATFIRDELRHGSPIWTRGLQATSPSLDIHWEACSEPIRYSPMQPYSIATS